jgi:alpha-1,3-rhamnosyl/mannosyltransferase
MTAESAGISLIFNVDAITPPLTGIGRYALRIAEGLQRSPSISDVRFFSAFRWVEDPHQALKVNRGIASVRRHMPAKSLALRLYFTTRQQMFNRLARKYRKHILHSPNYLLFEHSGPRVTTVHDLSWLHYPQYHPKERVKIMHRRMPRSMEMADAVITDSEFVRREVIQTFALDPARVHAIPLGVDDSFRPHTDAETLAALTKLKLRHGSYLLALATLEPRKNLERLIDAYERLDPTVRKRFPLVLGGATGWHASALVARIDKLAARGEAKRLGFVAEEDLPSLLAGARALAFPSIYEGFGLPPLEAMASGVPVVASSSSCIPEVTGNAALLVPPEDVEGLTSALERGLTDDAWRTTAASSGLQRARNFTWQRCVDATIQIYRNVAAGGG